MSKREYAITDPRNPDYDAHARGIAKAVIERLREPDMQAKLIEDGRKVARAIVNLYEECRKPINPFDRKYGLAS